MADLREEHGDLWARHAAGFWVGVTTNGVTRRDGACVMGRGVAKEAATRFPGLPYALGAMLRRDGNHVCFFPVYRMITFPVKHHWREPADLQLIEQSARELVSDLTLVFRGAKPVYLVRPGCGNGGLDWPTVRAVLAPILGGAPVVILDRDL